MSAATRGASEIPLMHMHKKEAPMHSHGIETTENKKKFSNREAFHDFPAHRHSLSFHFIHYFNSSHTQLTHSTRKNSYALIAAVRKKTHTRGF